MATSTRYTRFDCIAGKMSDPDAVSLYGGRIAWRGKLHPVAGATAEYQVGAQQSSVTAGRVIALGALALAAKKNTTRIYLTITTADGTVIDTTMPVKYEREVRTLVRNVNAAAAL